VWQRVLWVWRMGGGADLIGVQVAAQTQAEEIEGPSGSQTSAPEPRRRSIR